MSFVPPQIISVNGSAVPTGTTIKVSATATFLGNGFPGKPLKISVNNGYTLPIPDVTPDSSGEWSLTLTSLKAGNTTLTITETDATPKTTSITFEVQNAISETLDAEDLRSSNLPIITKEGIMFWPNGIAERQILKSSEALHKTTILAHINDAERVTKFGKNSYMCRSTGQPGWLNSIFLNGKDNSNIKFSKISFWYYSIGNLRLEFFDGSKIIGKSTAIAGMNQLVFESPAITEVRLLGNAAGDYFVLSNIVITPI
jgi:hypothetical protein